MTELKLDQALIKKVISATQNGLPICERPYQRIAEQLGIGEDELIELMQKMLSAGLIRRVGLVPNHYALGYRFNLMTVWDVADQSILALGEKVGQLDFVSHCYQRPRQEPDWHYNLFAMVHGRDEQEVEQQVAQIKQLLGDACRAMTQLNSLKILKKTGLRIRS
ncbi:MAG: nitrite reductase [Pseudomonadales bacterium]|nr:nitrite reductase [Pseudomonadales bacterium]